MRMIAAGVMMSAALAAPAAAYAQGQQQPGNQQPGGGYIKRVEPREHERIVFTQNVGYVPSNGLGYEASGERD